jgi:tetratricopeptide (TPR) repeat protein
MKIFLERLSQFVNEPIISLLLWGMLAFISWCLLETSEKFLQFLVKIFPKSYKLHYKLGYLLSGKPELRDDAEKELRLSISLNPNVPGPYYTLAKILWKKLNWDEEIEALCNIMFERFPQSPWPFLYLGYSHEKRNDFVNAENYYRKAIAIAPNLPAAYDYLIDILHRDNRFDEAQQVYPQVIKLLPRKNEKYYLYSALNYHIDGKYSEAVTAYKHVIRINPSNLNAYKNLAILQHEKLNQPEEAEKAYRQVIQLNPDNPDDYFNLGLLLLEHSQRYGEAETMFQKTLEFNPQDEYALYNIACIKAVLKDFDSALNYLKKAIQKGFDKSEAWDDPDLESLHDDPRFVDLVGLQTIKE